MNIVNLSDLKPLSRAKHRQPSSKQRWLGLSPFRQPAASLRRRLRALRIFFFVSYARDDLAAVKPILDAARDEGHLFWIDHLDLGPADIWSGDIVTAIRASRAFVLFCSARAFASRDVYRELVAASRMNKPILPVFIEPVQAPDDFLYYLSVHQAIRVGDPGWRERFFCALEAMEKRRRRWWNTGDPRSKCPPSLVATGQTSN